MIKQKSKNTAPWTYVVSDPKGKEKKRIAETNQKEFRVEKITKRKLINYM